MPREFKSNGRDPFGFQAKGPSEYARGTFEYGLHGISTRLDPAAAASISLYIITMTPVQD